MKNTAINLKIDPEFKAQAESVLHGIGLSTSTVIGMLFRQIVYQQGLPFEAKLPNEETLQAMEDARAGKTRKAASGADLIARLKGRAEADGGSGRTQS